MLRIREHNRFEGHTIPCVCVHNVIMCMDCVYVSVCMCVCMYIPGQDLISACSTFNIKQLAKEVQGEMSDATYSGQLGIWTRSFCNACLLV